MDIIYNDKIKKLMQKNRTIHIKIESLDWEENVLGVINGKCVNNGGTITVTNNDMVRRQCNFQFITDKETDIKEGSPFWINKKIRVYLGVANSNKREDVTWFNWGIYMMGNPSKDISVNGNTITVQGYDKMHYYGLNDFSLETKIYVDTPMHEAIKSIGMLANETKYKIQENDYVIPYDQEIDATETLQDRLQKFQEMYMDFQIHYDVEGYLCYESTYSKENDPIYWSFNNDDKDIEISRNENFDYDSIRNYIKVLGRYDEDTGKRPSYLLEIKDSSTFSQQTIEKRGITVNMDNYTREDQCKLYAEYIQRETYKFGKQITITCLPLYFLNDVNVNIEVIDGKIRYVCCVDDISCPVGDGTMTITCHVIAEYDIGASLYGDTLNGLYSDTVEGLGKRTIGDIGKDLY